MIYNSLKEKKRNKDENIKEDNSKKSMIIINKKTKKYQEESITSHLRKSVKNKITNSVRIPILQLNKNNSKSKRKYIENKNNKLNIVIDCNYNLENLLYLLIIKRKFSSCIYFKISI